jgi:hypothetical protein
VGDRWRQELLVLRYALLVHTIVDKTDAPGVGGQGPDAETLMELLGPARHEALAAT